jgi:hypothetical protein
LCLNMLLIDSAVVASSGMEKKAKSIRFC